MVRDLGPDGFAGKASSAILQGGSYELCEGREFRGRCVVLPPGRYPSLAAVGIDNVVASLRGRLDAAVLPVLAHSRLSVVRMASGEPFLRAIGVPWRDGGTGAVGSSAVAGKLIKGAMSRPLF